MTTDADLKAIAEKAEAWRWGRDCHDVRCPSPVKSRIQGMFMCCDMAEFLKAFNPTEALKQLEEKAALIKRVEELEGVLRDAGMFLPTPKPGSIGEERITKLLHRIRKALEGSK